MSIDIFAELLLFICALAKEQAEDGLHGQLADQV